MLEMMEREITRKALRFHVSHDMWCPKCHTVLDVSRAVETDFLRGENLLKSIVQCAKCHDAIVPEFKALAERNGLTLKINDGRELFAQPTQPEGPKPAVVPNPVHAKDVVIGGRYRMRHGAHFIVAKVVGLTGKDHWSGRRHYLCVNERTGREIVVKSAAKFNGVAA